MPSGPVVSRPRRGARAVVLLAALAACAPPSRQDLQTAQALDELGVSFNDIRQGQQELQDRVDSLRLVVARQDSLLRTLANLAGVPVPP